ncbi:uncharacterized protein LOC143910192 [Arctopsyche grandis]|uniref:uncharacterized protein LOC143910192 n=1 Tax=Arctopsyche grandis TaxID=121162 RepID=UPI00406D8CBF
MICKLPMSHFLCVILLSTITFDLLVSASKDRFNIYKGTDAEELSDLLNPDEESKISYFYRTPQLGGIGTLRVGQTPPVDFGKRTINRFKNYMLAKENQGEDDVGKEEIDPFFG